MSIMHINVVIEVMINTIFQNKYNLTQSVTCMCDVGQSGKASINGTRSTLRLHPHLSIPFKQHDSIPCSIDVQYNQRFSVSQQKLQ